MISKSKAFSFILAALVSSSARAEIAGSWDGQATTETHDYGPLNETYTSDGFFIFERTPQLFTLAGCGFYISDTQLMTCHQMQFEIRGDELWSEGKAVGSLTADHFKFSAKGEDDLVATWEGTVTAGPKLLCTLTVVKDNRVRLKMQGEFKH